MEEIRKNCNLRHGKQAHVDRAFPLFTSQLHEPNTKLWLCIKVYSDFKWNIQGFR